MKKCIWEIQFLYVMTLLFVFIFTNVLGTVLEVKQASMMDRLERKKYIGLCGWNLEIVARTMSRFPSMVPKYRAKNNVKKKGWSLGFLLLSSLTIVF